MLRRNVLIFHAGALGDFVLTWPLAAALGRLHPQSRIIYITHASKGALAAKVLRLEWQDAETGWPAIYADPAQLPEKCRKTLAEAHSIYTFAALADKIVPIAPDTTVISLHQIPPETFTGHATSFLLNQLASVPAVQTAVAQILASIGAKGIGTVRAGARADAPILIHPGSGSRQKCWPVEHFLRLIEKLRTKGAVKIILGDVELERFSKESLRQLESAGPVCRPTTYLDLLNELAQAAAFIGNDSGPAHLSGIIGVPTLTLFGPTNPAVWRPLGPRTTVLAADDLATLEVETVYDATRTMLEDFQRL